jgi:hypothetical protein
VYVGRGIGMRKENQAEKDVLNGLSRIINKVPAELRQEAFKGLAKIYVNIVDEEMKGWIEEICIHHCHLCDTLLHIDDNDEYIFLQSNLSFPHQQY